MNTPAPVGRLALQHGAFGGLVALLIACATTPAPRDQPCTGQRTLVVTNQTSTEVDVVAVDGRTEKVLGMAGPGRHEFMLSDVSAGARFVAKRNGQYVSTAFSTPAAARQVEFRVDCR